MNACLLILTCANIEEAEKISRRLLEKKLVLCVKKTPITSSFLWEGEMGDAQEVLLLMDSLDKHFSAIEHEVRKIHSYKTFVLFSLPIHETTKDVETWFKKELGKSTL